MSNPPESPVETQDITVETKRKLARRLSEVALREEVELTWIDLPSEQAEPLLERGLLPGCRICPIRMSPAGDPIVMVDGSLIALRRETARCLCVGQEARKPTDSA